ncbi:MAG: hypothetical protein WCD47_23850 [Candidatus Sulfotelmatobacter sp.]
MTSLASVRRGEKLKWDVAHRILILFLFLASALAYGQQDQPAPAGDPAQSNATNTSQLDLQPDADGALSQEQMQRLFRVVADKDMENDKRLRDYTYLERDEEQRLDNKGQVKSTEVKTYDVMELYGEQVQRLIEKDDKPLDAKDAAKEEEKIQKVIDKRKNESEEERNKREKKEEKDREEDRKFVREVADAYNFKLIGTELVGGREAWVIDGEPRPDFVPHMKESKFLTKFRGRVWIDKSDLQLARMDVECLDTISWGLFLARFHKGSRFMLEQTRVNQEVWLPRQLTAKVDVRLALLKNFNVDVEQSFRDYKKFRATTKIMAVEDLQKK